MEEKKKNGMRIFQICNKSPFPPKEGGSIAMNNITQGMLAKGHTVKILAFSTPKYFVDEKTFPPEYIKKTGIETVFIDNTVKLTDAFFNLFSSQSYHIKRFVSKEFENKIISILQKETFDIIQLETIYISPYIETIHKYSDAKIVLRSHNIEYLIWERLASSANNFFRKAYLKHLANTLKKYEIKTVNKFDGIAAITSKDAEQLKVLGCKKPICDIPLGIDLNNYSIVPSYLEIPSLFHIGSMNWMPNEEAVKWFISNVWDDIHAEYPTLKLYLAGRNMPDWLLEMKMPNIEIVGEVEDALTFISSKQIMIVPLLSGSGMRVKIMEGMALGKIIISTTIGAEGIDYENGKNIVLADSPEEFNKMIKYYLNDQNSAEQVGIQAKKLIKEKYDNKVITEKLIAFYHQLLNN